jgi:hypothetical protein
MTKYTHIPEAQSAVHPINKYIFMYRREALVNINEEVTIEDELVIRLLYGEVVHTTHWELANLKIGSLFSFEPKISMSGKRYSVSRRSRIANN